VVDIIVNKSVGTSTIIKVFRGIETVETHELKLPTWLAEKVELKIP
jgi:hypothetical protein